MSNAMPKRFASPERQAARFGWPRCAFIGPATWRLSHGWKSTSRTAFWREIWPRLPISPRKKCPSSPIFRSTPRMSWRSSSFAAKERRASRRLMILSRQSLEKLLENVPPQSIEVILHSHVPMFHTAHCLFCAELSTGRDPTDCGRPCRRHRVRIRDRLGVEHVLLADADCRNTLYHADRAKRGGNRSRHCCKAACGTSAWNCSKKIPGKPGN